MSTPAPPRTSAVPTPGDAAILDALRRGNYQRPSALRVLELFRVEPAFFADLAAEGKRLVADEQPIGWDDPANNSRYDKPYGTALQYSLFNESGRFDDVSGIHVPTAEGKAFHHAGRYPTLGRLVEALPGKWNLRLNVMSRSSGVRPHKEFIIVRSGGRSWVRARFHLPLQTNPGAQVYLDGDWFHLDEGSVFLFNNGCIHTAVNDGDSPRLHLVWDARLTREVMDALFGVGDVAPFLRWVPAEERLVEPVRRQRRGSYEVSPFYLSRYRRLHLDKLRVPPWRFQDAATRVDWARQRREPLSYAAG